LDLKNALEKHGEWRLKFRSAIANNEALDVATVSKDNCCELGKWLHGEAKSLYDRLPAYAQCISSHAAFHHEAGRIATLANAKKHSEALKALGIGSAYATASTEVGTAIFSLKSQTTGAGNSAAAAKSDIKPFLAWSDNYSVGVGTLDEQHTSLFDTLNQLHASMMKGQSQNMTGELLQKLVKYTKSHFAAEEGLMRAAKFPGLTEHLAKHRALTGQVDEFVGRFQRGEVSMNVPLLNFLREWLTTHILKEDKEYAPYLKESNNR
jgi:methyl-accepting chemotaxis protein